MIVIRGFALIAFLVSTFGAAWLQAKDHPTQPAKLEFSRTRGFCSAPFELQLACAVRDATIRFTMDGSAPSPDAGRVYTSPLDIKTTTTLRAAGFKEAERVTEVGTHTYVFPADVLKQTGVGAPATWGTNQGQAVPADYEMDPEIIEHPAYRKEFPEALKVIPTLSLVMAPSDLFGAAVGIYANPRQSGEDWERPGSVELIQPDSIQGFQVDCGVRIQGGWNRRPEESPKHAFRLAFRKKYGAGKLRFRLFESAGPEEFDGLILRAGCNNSWLHWNSAERGRGDYIRDQWMRESHAAMGNPSARGTFVHLYLNGLYWGLYNLTERPDEAFAAAHFGGKSKDYDARNGDRLLAGDDSAWQQMLSLANAGLRSDQSYQAIQEMLDVPSFIDFMIVNLYGANADWDHASNWYAARRRSPPGQFHFFIWDGERTLEEVAANTLAFDDDQSPPRLFQKLRENAEFRLQFADRVHLHLGNDGALTPGAAAERFRAWTGRLDKPIVAESARWGDYRRDVHPYKVGPYTLYTRDEHWRPETQRLLNQYFPHRTAILLKQFREAGLYPAVEAPTVRQVEHALAWSAPAGSIYYTLDGSDPRLPGGQLAGSARKYETPLAAPPGSKIRARAVTGQGASLQWSALAEGGAGH